MKFSRVRMLAGGVVLVGSAVLVPGAFASAPSGFTATTLVTADLDQRVKINSDGVKLQTKEPTDVRVQRVVIAAGGSSGWHHHPGVVIVAIDSGSLTVWDSECNATTYGPGLPTGAVFVESGDEPGQVTSVNGGTSYATFIAPSADPPVFRIEDNPPPCA